MIKILLICLLLFVGMVIMKMESFSSSNMPSSLSAKLQAGIAIAVIATSPIIATGAIAKCGPGCGSKNEQVQKDGCCAAKNNCCAANKK